MRPKKKLEVMLELQQWDQSQSCCVCQGRAAMGSCA